MIGFCFIMDMVRLKKFRMVGVLVIVLIIKGCIVFRFSYGIVIIIILGL